MRAIAVLLIFIALLSAPAFSEPQSNEALSKEISNLKRQVAALEQRLDLVISMINRQGGATTAGSTLLIAPPAAKPSEPSPNASSSNLAPTRSAAPTPAASRIQCQATTKKGAQCLRLAAAGASYCWQHGR
jgi:hypothetical protein